MDDKQRAEADKGIKLATEAQAAIGIHACVMEKMEEQAQAGNDVDAISALGIVLSSEDQIDSFAMVGRLVRSAKGTASRLLRPLPTGPVGAPPTRPHNMVHAPKAKAKVRDMFEIDVLGHGEAAVYDSDGDGLPVFVMNSGGMMEPVHGVGQRVNVPLWSAPNINASLLTALSAAKFKRVIVVLSVDTIRLMVGIIGYTR